MLDAIVTARLPQVSSSSSSVLPRIEDGALMAIAFSAPSADLATAIPAAIAAVGNPAITAVELDAAVAEAELGYTKASIPPRELTRTLIAWRDRGLEGDPRPARYSALKQLSVEAMRGFGARVETAPLTIAIVGDLGNLDRAALGRLGDVSEVNIDDVVER